MQVADPAALAVGLGLLAGLPGASLARRGRRLLGAGGAAAAGAALASGVLELPASAGLAAAAAGLASALGLPGLGLGRFRRRSFGGGAFGPGSSGLRLAEARLPAHLAAARPSELVDPADRLRLEGAIDEAERKSGAELALAVVRRAGTYEGASWRLAAWCAALALAAACAFAPAAPRLAPAAALLAALGGHILARAPLLLRFASSEAELAENAARGACDAFARLGLARGPDGRASSSSRPSSRAASSSSATRAARGPTRPKQSGARSPPRSPRPLRARAARGSAAPSSTPARLPREGRLPPPRRRAHDPCRSASKTRTSRS